MKHYRNINKIAAEAGNSENVFNPNGLSFVISYHLIQITDNKSPRGGIKPRSLQTRWNILISTSAQ